MMLRLKSNWSAAAELAGIITIELRMHERENGNK